MATSQQWSSKLGFLYATAGSAIGLGAIWKFPYIAGTSGGGAFFVLFLAFTLLIGVPLLIGEYVLGRHSGRDAISTYKMLAPRSVWSVTGWLGVVTCFLILSFYSVVGGWSLIYLGSSLFGQLGGLDVEGYQAKFTGLIANPYLAVGAQALFLGVTAAVVQKGVQKGIERASKWMIPALFVLLALLSIYSLTLDGAKEGLAFLFKPDWESLSSEVVLFALGQSFFALSIGVSVMVTFSSYASKKQDLPVSAATLGVMNIFVAMLAGIVIFPGVFTFGLEPSEGPTLIFAAVPAIFSQMPFGDIVVVLFFMLFFFAALSTAFSLLEIVVAAFMRGDGSKRAKGSWLIALFVLLMGIPSALSFGVMGDVHLFGMPFFDLVDFLVSNLLMPIGSLLICIFLLVKVKRQTLAAEFQVGSVLGKKGFALWYTIMTGIVPVAIAVVLIDQFFGFNLFALLFS
ncbi:putative sodium-dependent transporter YhdH [Shouchella clausii]|uniref:sodium-dependent transporter n=1 Tax=Shouchella tritolerans TaxID=2979466 RepID=UPI001B140F05|nr:sodium-dependent transporter [Shouchella tritolerans]GIN13961.1 putative sodium-dependent transporter YhdH [Shouchella clausii]